jgi:hypothetical protein
MAQLLVDHLSGYHQNKQAWKSARNLGNHQRAQQLFEQMKYNQLTVAMIQSDYPGVKTIADEIMAIRAKETKERRKSILESDQN